MERGQKLSQVVDFTSTLRVGLDLRDGNDVIEALHESLAQIFFEPTNRSGVLRLFCPSSKGATGCTMSPKFKSQASSARAASGAFAQNTTAFGFGGPQAFQTTSSSLSYITELPDLTGVSEPSIVVTFKNLGKKDSITKGKALEELQEYLTSAPAQGPEAGFLEAWVGSG